MSPDDPLPPYSYVPGGPWPHPISGDGGHLADSPSEPVAPIEADAWHRSPAYLRGVRLYNAGYYWEAHEAWEALWHAHHRRGPIADVLKALIKLAAAGVKVRQGQPRGVSTHALRAAELLEAVVALGFPCLLGLDLPSLAILARRLAADPPSAPADPRPVIAGLLGPPIAPKDL
ncbi:DUF309 domain-containing protein [Tautonia rosea]|uniref:DUF309 domain-containing protein n=1 Tax=Tautonia rosea TaxID=2728037 RepID=UPI0014731D42|nr:DUF309 domain-containing protein [Tautonia rosea]